MLIAQQIVFLVIGAVLLLGSGLGLVGLIGPLRRAVGRFDTVPVALLLSSGVCGVWAAIGRIAGMRIGAWSVVFLAISLSLLAAGWFTRARARVLEERRGAAPPRPFHGIVLGIAALAFALVCGQGGSLGPVHDSLDFVAFVNETLQTGELAPDSPIYRADPGLPPDPRRGSFHTEAAAICYLSRTSPTDGWRWLPRLLVPLTILGFAAMLRAWLGERVAWLGTLLFLATTIFTLDRFIQNIGYASRLGWVIGWAGLLALARGVEERRAAGDAAASRVSGAPTPPRTAAAVGPTTAAGAAGTSLAAGGAGDAEEADEACRARRGLAWLTIAAVSPAILVFVHLLSGAQTALALGCGAVAIWVDRGATRSQRRETLLVMIAAGFLLGGALAFRLGAGTGLGNPIFDHVYGVMEVAPGWPVLLPRYVMERFSWAGVAGAALGLLLLGRARRSRAAGFLAFSTSIPLLILFFPPIVRIVLGAHAHSLLFRVILTIPYAATLAYCALEGVDRLRGGGGLPVEPARRSGQSPRQTARSLRRSPRSLRRFVFGFALLAVVAAGLAGQFASIRSSWAIPERRRAEYRENQALVRALEFLDRRYSSVQTVLSDPLSSYSIPAYTKHDAVAPLDQHSSPADPSVDDRIRDVQVVLNGRVGMARTFDVIRRYAVNLVLVNQSFERLTSSYYYFVTPLAYLEQSKKFDDHPELFERIYDADGIIVYAVRDPGLGATLSGDPPNPDRIDDPGTPPILASGPVEMLRFEVAADPVRPGEPFTIHVDWRRTSAPYLLPVVCEVKVQNRAQPAKYDRPLVGRAGAVLDERRSGKVWRFGRTFRPLAAFYPDFLWTPGEVYKDLFWIRVPPNTRRGVCDIYVRLGREPYAPVIRLDEQWSTHLGAEWKKLGVVEISE